MKKKQLVIIGGGPAGLCAAASAYDNGIRDILILERDTRLGGILRQCIHNGFGLHKFKEELTGPEYAERCIRLITERNIEYKLGTTVTNLTSDRIVTAVNAEDGIFEIKANAVILAMGCRERSRGALNIPGSRPAGIYSAGTAQKLVNIMGYMPGREIVILGSGDIGLIMARRMTLEGADVKAVCELLPYSGGLARNIVQCLRDFDIPLLLSHTIVKIHGKARVEGVTIAEVDEKRRPKPDTEKYISCDTVLLSCGLIPENELSKCAEIELDCATGGAYVDQSCETLRDGIFSCGNVLHVHDLADFVSSEAEIAGAAAAKFIQGKKRSGKSIPVKAGFGIRYTVPQRITSIEDMTIYFRVCDVYENAVLKISDGGRAVYRRKLKRATPGEMNEVVLSAADIESTSELTVELEV